MDLVNFCQALIHCGVIQALARNSIIAQGYGDMDVFTRFLANDQAAMDLVKSINKLPAAPDGDQPSIPFASGGFKGHCAIVHGSMNIPLAYVLRDHDIVTPKIRAAD
jgi:hypothetical protein